MRYASEAIQLHGRRWPRQVLNVEGGGYLGSSNYLRGTVLDCNEFYGVFFSPTEAWLDGELLSGDGILDRLEIGDCLTLELCLDGRTPTVIEIEICWVGRKFSQMGFGGKNIRPALAQRRAA